MNWLQRLRYLVLSAIVIALDAFTKSMVIERIPLHTSIPVIADFFQLVHVRNTGAAFGIGANASSPLVPLLLNFGAIAVFILVVVYSFRTAVDDRLLQIGLHLILGGALGNLIDRFRFGSVVDFLDVYVTIGGREHHWPAFNVADSAICIGIGLLFLDMWRKPSTTPEAA
ncbi:MAG TPA: signal peptidase II [Thermoanaerobaculia bacterium]|nr:signal peptidase II [Thermoanaerobaculia bacterium]